MTNVPVLLPVWETLSIAWDKVKGTKGSIWAAMGLIFLIVLGLIIIETVIKAFSHNLGGLVSFIVQIFKYVISMGVVYIAIRRALDLPFSYKDAFSVLKDNKPFKLIGLYLLMMLIFLPGIVLGLVGFMLAIAGGIIRMEGPGHDFSNTALVIICLAFLLASIALSIYIGVRIWLSAAFILDQNNGPWTAIKKSFQATQDNFWRLVGCGLMQLLIVIISAIPLGIGLIWTLPWAHICYGTIYRKLMVNTNTAPTATPVVTTP